MIRIHYITLLCGALTLHSMAIGQSISSYTQRIAELEQKLNACQQKKIELLRQCDTNNYLRKVDRLHAYVMDAQTEKQANNRTISALQRTIAEHNRQLLSSMTEEDKAALKQLLREYKQLWQELCLHPQENEGQPNTFELFFI